MNLELTTNKSLFNEFYNEAKRTFPNYDKHSDLFPRMILLNLTEFNLEINEIEDMLDGLGSKDFGIDCYFKDNEDNFHIFQFKSKEHFKENNNKIIINNMHDEIDSFVNTIDKLKNDAKLKNTKLIEFKEEISHYPESKFFFHYYIQEALDENKIDEYKKNYLDKNLEIYDLFQLNDLYKEYLSKNEDTLKSLEFSIDSYLNVDTVSKRFIVIIDGFEIYNLMKNKKFQLFKNNVRFFLGATQSVNKDIIKTIKNYPDHFFSFNNGITIEATSLKNHKSSNKIFLENPSIINGAQTVNCIFNAYKDLFKNNKEDTLNIKISKLEQQFKRIKVLAKIIIVDEINNNFSKDLSKYVNSQNSIKEADFFSNLEEQISLKKILGLKYNLFYEIKRGELKYYRNKTRKSTLEDITGLLFANFNKKHYLKLEEFNRNYIAVFHNPSSSFHSVNNLFRNNNNLYFTEIQPKLLKDSFLMCKEMLFSYFLVTAIKEELTNYKKFYQMINNPSENIDNIEKTLVDINLPNKDILFKNLKNISAYEEDFGSLNISLMSKGKYIYSYLIHFFLKNLLFFKTTNENKFQNFLDSDYLNDYNKFKSLIIPLFYKLNSIFEKFFIDLIAEGKTENSICMNVNIKDLESIILNYVKEIKKNNKIEDFFSI